MCCDGTRFFVANTLKAPQAIFRKTVSIDVCIIYHLIGRKPRLERIILQRI